jgi:cold shock CspA family protein
MGRSQESWNKKEVRKKKEKKKQDKEKKKIERKANSREGGSLDDMIAYVDENGVISSTPPDPTRKTVVNVDDIEIAVPKREDVPEEKVRTGTVAFFNDSKGYGFIRDEETRESVFVHINSLIDSIQEGDKVNFEVEMGKKGLSAIEVKKIGK